MKEKLKGFIKGHPGIMDSLYFIMQKVVLFIGVFIPVKSNSMIFVSLSGRNFDDSPKAIYDEVCSRKEFNEWELIWAFKGPNEIDIPRGKKIKFGDLHYWFTLLSTKVWIDNGGIDSGLNLNRKRNIIVRTWHGSAIKYAEEKNNPVLQKFRHHQKIDNRSIRCAQNDLDIRIYTEYFRASADCFLKCGLPRNDCLLQYSKSEINAIRDKLEIPTDKKIILYMPTWRDYIKDEGRKLSEHPPINIERWREQLGKEYVFLFRGHYSFAKALKLADSDFVKNVSEFQPLSDLYAIADIMISDYSSAFYDFSALCRPIRCYAYDFEEYNAERGLSIDLEKELPCQVSRTEKDLLESIVNMDLSEDCKKTEKFKKKYMKYFKGNASSTVVDEICNRLKGR